MKRLSMVLALLTAAVGSLLITTTSASAAPPSNNNNKADVTVSITVPTNINVMAAREYSVVVSNTGNRDASDVRLTITLPKTNTRPTVHILGTRGAFDGRCTKTGTNLVCLLDTIRKDRSTTARFTIALPESAAPLVIGAAVTTASDERSDTNNTASATVSLVHPNTPITIGKTSVNQHCTGTNLTSFFECTLYPSSISSHSIQFLTGGALALVSPTSPTFTGTWSQAAGTNRLTLEYFDSGSLEARFTGWAVGGNCFEGVTTFFPTSAYSAVYRVCVQP